MLFRNMEESTREKTEETWTLLEPGQQNGFELSRSVNLPYYYKVKPKNCWMLEVTTVNHQYPARQ